MGSLDLSVARAVLCPRILWFQRSGQSLEQEVPSKSGSGTKVGGRQAETTSLVVLGAPAELQAFLLDIQLE